MAKQTKTELEKKIELAQATGKYMIAVWQLNGTNIELFRLTNMFPTADLEPAIKLLQDNLKKDQPSNPPAIPVKTSK